MSLFFIDTIILVLYLSATVFIGFLFKGRVHKTKEFFLSRGNKVSWGIRLLSNVSGMFENSGTVWLVTILFVYGLFIVCPGLG